MKEEKARWSAQLGDAGIKQKMATASVQAQYSNSLLSGKLMHAMVVEPKE